KLHALEKKHREARHIAKADRIKNNNLGTKKVKARKDKAQKRIANIASKAAHSGGMLQSCVWTTSKASSDPVWVRLLTG
ncbi:hypothetical protein AB6A68_15205, partial [Ferrimicrobium acidiphilum]